MPEEAVLDAPELEVDDSTDIGEAQDTAEGDASEGETREVVQDEPAVIEAEGKFKLSGKALDTLNKLKAEDPRQAREFRAALFEAATLKKEFPEGIREAIALKQWKDEIGGDDAIESMRGNVDSFQKLNDSYNAADPKFVDELVNASAAAFSKVAPQIMGKLAEIDNPVFTHEVSKVMLSDMSTNEIPMALKLLRREIEDPENPGKVKSGMGGVLETYNTLSKYFERVTKFATDKPAAKEQQQKTTNDVDSREQALTVKEFASERSAVKNSVTEAEFNKNAGARKLPGEKVTVIRELYESALNRAVQSVAGHKEKVDRYLAAKDRVGYRKYMEGVIKSKAPEAMRAAFKRAGVGDKPGPKVAVKTAAKTAAVAGANGFTRVGSKPNINDVNWTATKGIPGKKTGDGRFVLRDGSKVLFQR